MTSPSPSNPNPEANLIVNYLPVSYREPEVYELFRPYGAILKVNIVYNKDTDESMTYGFVRYQNPSDAIVAMSELNGREIFGKRIKVGFARPGIDTTNCKLYVKRVPPSYTLDDVHSLFSQFGEILESRLLTDAKGHSRQVAFVQYTNRQGSESAIRHLSGSVPPRGVTPLIVKYATHPRQALNGNGPSSSNGQEQKLFDQFDQMKLQYQQKAPSPPPPAQPTPGTQSSYDFYSIPVPGSYSSSTSPPSSSKVDHFLHTKPRSSDWTDHSVSPPPPSAFSSSSLSSLLSSSPPSSMMMRASSSLPLSHTAPTSSLVMVTVSSVPPALDLMDFHFLSKYGKVLEGKIMTRDVQVIYPDGVPINYQTSSGIIEFTLNVTSFPHFKNLSSLNGSMIVVQGHSVLMQVSPLR
jgi:RNA recognition motif-containing protein